MGRSVSYPSAATVVTFKHMESSYVTCDCGADVDTEQTDTCDECGASNFDVVGDDFDDLIEDFRDQLKELFPSTSTEDKWLGREDHALAVNGHAYFGMSEYCGLVSYWIVPRAEVDGYDYSRPSEQALQERWIRSIADKFVAAFGELTKVGSFSNGEGVYRRIDK